MPQIDAKTGIAATLNRVGLVWYGEWLELRRADKQMMA